MRTSLEAQEMKGDMFPGRNRGEAGQGDTQLHTCHPQGQGTGCRPSFRDSHGQSHSGQGPFSVRPRSWCQAGRGCVGPRVSSPRLGTNFKLDFEEGGQSVLDSGTFLQVHRAGCTPPWGDQSWDVNSRWAGASEDPEKERQHPRGQGGRGGKCGGLVSRREALPASWGDEHRAATQI